MLWNYMITISHLILGYFIPSSPIRELAVKEEKLRAIPSYYMTYSLGSLQKKDYLFC